MPLIRIETTPTAAMVYDCWDRIATDPVRHCCLSDTDPQSVGEFLALAGDTILPCIAYMGHDPAALVWLSHIAMTVPAMTPVSAQMHLYLLPEWRNRPISPACAAIIREAMASYGFEHIFVLARVADEETRHALDACGFTCQAILPAWERYAGDWHNMALYDSHFERA